jgi:ABC-type lipoprotein release transport system permease subunit
MPVANGIDNVEVALPRRARLHTSTSHLYRQDSARDSVLTVWDVDANSGDTGLRAAGGMNRRGIRVAAYRSRATMRRQWGAGLVVVLLIGIVSGVGLAALAGARRTETSFSAFFSQTNPSNLGIAAFTSKPSDFTKKIAALPNVVKVSDYLSLQGELLRTGHKPEQLLPNVSIVGSVNGEFFNQDRFSVTAGRRANPRRSDEIMVSQSAAALLHLSVGERVTIGFFSNAGNTIAETRKVTVVGIGLLNSQVVQDDVAKFPTYIIATPALTAELTPQFASVRWYELTLRGGNRSVSKVEHEVFGNVTAYLVFQSSSVYSNEAQLAIKPDATALWVFGALASLAGLVMALQAVARQLHARDRDLQVLRAIGAGPATTISDGMVEAILAIVLGSILAVVVSVALSPLMPIGPARAVFPTPGLSIDWTVLGLGLAVLVVVLGVAALIIAYRGAPHRHVLRTQKVVRDSSFVRAVSNAGGSPATTMGVRFALEPGRRGAISTRPALFGAVVALAIVTATLTFGSGLSTLASHPALYGSNWNYALDSSSGYGPVPPTAQQALSSDPYVARWTGMTFFTMQIDGLSTPVLFADAPASFSPPIISGHALRTKNQIVLGQATLAQLGKRVGERVVVQYGSPGRSESRSLRIVGTSTLPAIGISEGLHTSMGTGAILANAAFANLSEQGYPKVCNGPNIDLVRIKSGVRPSVAVSSLQRIAKAATSKFTSVNSSCNLILSVIGVQKPGQIRDYGSVGVSPTLLASGLASGAVVALALTLVASVRRRRRELALLKALGFTQRQLAATVAWQASIVGVVGVLFGVPLGIALGRWLWTLFAREIYAVPDAAVPALSIALVAVSALVLVNVIAALPGRSAARTETALVLRAE